MKNLFDYIKYYGDFSFQDILFNDVDSLIFAKLSYAKFQEIVPSDIKSSISLKEACQLFLEKYSEKDFKEEDWLFPIAYRIIHQLQNSSRFAHVRCYHLVKKVDEEGQFGAITFRLPNGITYISFEGTDSSVIGWKEDFEMVYQFPVSSQVMAQKYFDETLNIFDRTIYVGGHSKGGNLAMYAYMYGKSYYKKRVKKVYNFDGPGFLEEVVSSQLYQEMIPKLVMFVPKDSIVGMFLGHHSFQAINSSAFSIFEHDGSSWECFGGTFVPTELSLKSQKLSLNLQEYISAMSIQKRKDFVQTLFQVLEKSHITNIMQLKDFKISTLLSIMKEFKNIPVSTKQDLVAILRLLLTGMN